MGEAVKIKPIIEKYLIGDIVDIGCGDSPIMDTAFGIDGRDFPCVNFITDTLYDLPSKLPDKVGIFSSCISSHVAEHLPDLYRAVKEWAEFCKQGGYFILYLPDGDYYNNKENPEHFHDTKYEPFLMWFTRSFCGEGRNFKGEQYAQPIFELIESGQDVKEENHYSFYIVAKKL